MAKTNININVSTTVEDLVSEVGVDEFLNVIGNTAIETWIKDNYTNSDLIKEFDISVGDLVEYHGADDSLEEALKQGAKVDNLLELVDRSQLLKAWKDLYE